jgi:Protein of unknown function (DUF2586)
MLNDVKFNVLQGGLGRQAEGEDHISALLFSAVAPTAYGTDKCKSFLDIEQVIADGITKGNATYGEAYYHAAEYWRINPGATLWLCFSATLAEVNTVAAGKVRQAGVFFSTFSDLSSVYQAAANALDAEHAPIQILAGYAGATALNLNTVADQGINTANNVSVLLAGDGAGDGFALATALTKPYIPAVGAVLGAMSKAAVHQSIAWVERFNLSDGFELETIRLADGTNNPSTSTLTALNTKRYLVFRKHVGISGSYLNDTHTCVSATNDYGSIELNRAIQKAKREIRKQLLPDLNSPLTVDGDTGKLAAGSIKYFENKTARPLNVMQAAGEISDFGVYINPNQDVLATSTLQIQVKIVPRGVARNIVVNIGFSITTSF